ncbi:MAG: glycosyltransferase family 2 protein [Bacteroidetes bacterium]|nr:glycosyltransferase family 2 protein [Bacteroidota bacterium]MDA1267655.1 glycosyltransferase family 2 protein [Bacteroidota bacterium]
MASTTEISVALILVNWNGYAYTKACLESLKEVKEPAFQVILVDNGSQETEGERLKALFPQVHLIVNQENLGFAGGNNVGIRYALEQGFEQVLLLNNDTSVKPSFLKELQSCLQQPGYGVAQPMILFAHDPHTLWSAGGRWNSLLGRAITLGNRVSFAEYRPQTKSLDWATGCCMLVSRKVLLQSGLLHESYFAYFEDVEWSLRIRKAGFTIGLAENAVIYHEAGAASKKQHAEGILSPRVFYLHVRNQLFLLRQHSVHLGYPYHLLRFLGWIAYFLIRGRFQKLSAVMQGLRDGLFVPLNTEKKWLR